MATAASIGPFQSLVKFWISFPSLFHTSNAITALLLFWRAFGSLLAFSEYLDLQDNAMEVEASDHLSHSTGSSYLYIYTFALKAKANEVFGTSCYRGSDNVASVDKRFYFWNVCRIQYNILNCKTTAPL